MTLDYVFPPQTTTVLHWFLFVLLLIAGSPLAGDRSFLWDGSGGGGGGGVGAGHLEVV